MADKVIEIHTLDNSVYFCKGDVAILPYGEAVGVRFTPTNGPGAGRTCWAPIHFVTLIVTEDKQGRRRKSHINITLNRPE